MKSYFISLIFISLIGCVDKKSEEISENIKKAPTTTIDTIKNGVWGEPESSVEITTRIDTTVRKKETKYWYPNKKLFQRVEYYDSLGNEYKQTDFDFYKDEESRSYVWYDTVKNESGYDEWIARIDSTFNATGRLKEIEQRYLGTELIEYFNSRGKVYKKLIYSEELVYSFWEEDNEFYARRNDIPISYAEWVQTSRTHFGEAIKLFYDSEIKARLRFKTIYNMELN